MTRQDLIRQIRVKKSYLCVGLDTDITKIPKHLLSEPDPVFAFNKAIIDATKDCCVSYKINTAFYEARGASGWTSMEKTVHYIGEEHFRIADAKRGDIGNTSDQYAKAFFETLPFDAITLSPYMGEDSIRPFLTYPGKWAIVLGLTSNKGSEDLQTIEIWDHERLSSWSNLIDSHVPVPVEPSSLQVYQKVLIDCCSWGTINNLMLVIGATNPGEFESIRKLTPDHFYLVPGVGAQGGSLEEISEKAMNKDVGLLVNVSRAIIYASPGKDFDQAARKIADDYCAIMKNYV